MNCIVSSKEKKTFSFVETEKYLLANRLRGNFELKLQGRFKNSAGNGGFSFIEERRENLC